MKSNPINGFDASGNPTGSFNVDDQLLTAGYAKAMHGWSFGLSGKSIHSSLGNVSASAVAADAGINFNNPFSNKISHAIVVQNMGGSLTYNEQSNSLPTVVRLGTAIHPTQKINLGFDVIAPKGGAVSAALGGELSIPLARRDGSWRCAPVTVYGPKRSRRHVGPGHRRRLKLFRPATGLRLGAAKRFRFQRDIHAHLCVRKDRTLRNHVDQRRAGKFGTEIFRFIDGTDDENSAPEEKATFQAPARRSLHEIQSGETLGSIAKQFYGDSKQWTKIAAANKNLITNPNDLETGMTIVIP